MRIYGNPPRDKLNYCVECLTSNGHCRFTVSQECYEKLDSLFKDSSNKVTCLNEYFDNLLPITEFIKQFTTFDDNIRIGNLDGVECEF